MHACLNCAKIQFSHQYSSTTGLIYLTADDMRYELQRVSTAQKGWHISIKVPEKVRPSDKLFKLVSVTRN